MRFLLVIAFSLGAGGVVAQTPSAPAAGGQNDCGCAGNAECLLFCGHRSIDTPGSIGSTIGNKGIGMQERIDRLDSSKKDVK